MSHIDKYAENDEEYIESDKIRILKSVFKLALSLFQYLLLDSTNKKKFKKSKKKEISLQGNR